MSARPNIVFILADDLGWADLSVYGQTDYRTPELDRLAEQGVRFTQAYSNSAVCSATRFALITGRYQYRLPGGLEEPLARAGQKHGLPPEHPSLPSLLRDAGYRTALCDDSIWQAQRWLSLQQGDYGVSAGLGGQRGCCTIEQRPLRGRERVGRAARTLLVTAEHPGLSIESPGS